MSVKRVVWTVGMLVGVSGNCGAEDDPYETYNRHAFALNQAVDKAIYRPVATVYKDLTPNYMQKRVSAFFDNLSTVPIIANDFLEAKFYEGSCNLWRLFFNSTIGLAGFYDVATGMGLPATTADFGITLTQWGYQNSHYFVIPLMGPSTVRDAIGMGVNQYTFSVYSYIPNVPVRNSLIGLNFIQTRAQLLDFQALADQASVDPYVFERNAYLQRRNYVLSQTVSDYQSNQSSLAAHGQDPFVDE